MASPSCRRSAYALATALVVLLAAPALSATFTVDTTADAPDANPGDGVCADASDACTLRAATEETFWLAGDDIVIVPAGTYFVQTQLSVRDVTMLGAGRDATTVEFAPGVGASVFYVLANKGSTRPIRSSWATVVPEP